MTRGDAELYGSIAVAKAVGVSLRQLYYWVDVLRVVHPQVRQHGTRTFRRFTSADLTRLQSLKCLVERGYTLKAAARMVNGR
jgi:DNA-binding transcriptional MerR regulator